jgi:hypothetical protein
MPTYYKNTGGLFWGKNVKEKLNLILIKTLRKNLHSNQTSYGETFE